MYVYALDHYQWQLGSVFEPFQLLAFHVSAETRNVLVHSSKDVVNI